MPTSAELVAMKEKARQDSLFLQAEYLRIEALAREREESFFEFDVEGREDPPPPSTQDWLSGSSGSASTTTATTTTNTGNRFHVVVGSFQVPENATGMVKRLSDRGYRPVEIRIKGYIGVSAGSYSSFAEAEAAMRRMQSTDPSLCPEDIYVYDSNHR